MSYYVYIIYSDFLQKHYVGSSEDLVRRLEAHNKGLSRYTSKASDWRLIYEICLPAKLEALVLEKKIKKEVQKGFWKI